MGGCEGGLVTGAAPLVFVLGVSEEGTGAGSCCTAEGGSFEGAAGLVTDDATEDGSTEAADDGSTLGVGAGGGGAVAECDGGGGGGEEEEV